MRGVWRNILRAVVGRMVKEWRGVDKGFEFGGR